MLFRVVLSSLVLLYLLPFITAQGCKANPELSCTKDVADTFQSIHNSVPKRSLTARGLLDVVFVIDEGALNSAQHYWTKQFLQILSEIFVISPEYTNVGVVGYSSTARVIIPLSPQVDICSFTSSVNSAVLRAGSSYLTSGLQNAISQLNSGRAKASKLTILITNGDWGNLGARPEASVKTLKAMGHFAVVILKHPESSIGLLRDVMFDYFVSYFGSKKLGFTVEMTPEYLRDLHSIVKHNKATGLDWPLDLEVSKAKCSGVGRICAVADRCVCEVRTIAKEYICIGKDEDPPEAVICEGPKSPIRLQGLSKTEVSWSEPVFSDNSGVVKVVTYPLPGLYQEGTYTVTSTATDPNKNTATCSFSFTVTK